MFLFQLNYIKGTTPIFFYMTTTYTSNAVIGHLNQDGISTQCSRENTEHDGVSREVNVMKLNWWREQEGTETLKSTLNSNGYSVSEIKLAFKKQTNNSINKTHK